MDRKSLATASRCIRFTLATASDQKFCTNKYIRSGYLKGLPPTLATTSLATASLATASLATASLATASYSGNCLWSYNGLFLMLILLKGQLWALATASKGLATASKGLENCLYRSDSLSDCLSDSLTRQPYQTASSDSFQLAGTFIPWFPIDVVFSTHKITWYWLWSKWLVSRITLASFRIGVPSILLLIKSHLFMYHSSVFYITEAFIFILMYP